MKKKAILVSVVILVITVLTYFINNKGQCCDLIFQAGWPFAFCGGSGGFVGKTEDHIIWSGLLFDFLFSFTFIFLLTLSLARICKGKFKDYLSCM